MPLCRAWPGASGTDRRRYRSTVLVTAALVPETLLLLPGTAGAATVLEAQRSAAHEAVRRVLAAGPERVVVVTCPPRSAHDVVLRHPLVPTTTAAGVPDARWTRGTSSSTPAATDARPAPEAGATVVQDPGASVGLALLAEEGWRGPTDALLLADGPRDPVAVRALGAEEVADGATALLLLGALSARRGPDAPLPDDPRAAAVDADLERDLVSLDAPAAARLAHGDPQLLAELAVSAWAPWQVLLGAAGFPEAGPPLRGTLLHASVPLGTTYLVVHWARA